MAGNNEITNNDFFASGGNSDEDMDLNSLFEKNTEETPEEKANIVKPKAEKPLSPLEQMRQAQNKRGLGAIVSKADLEEKPLKHSVFEDEERIEEFEARKQELDESFEKRKYVTVIKHPQNEADFAKMMLELDSVKINDDGTASINYTDKDGNLLEPEFIRLRKEGDEAFDIKGASRPNNTNVQKSSEGSKSEDASSDESKTNDEKDNAEDEEMKKTVQILIDKTGLGTDFILNDIEKQKVIEADEIKLTEIEFVDIESVIKNKSNKSFQESISEYQLSSSKTTICFPASGFRAQMKGLTYGEMSDIALSMDNVTFDQYYKRLSIIYNKLTNLNIAPFESFTDFLKGFAYVDIPMALYGLYVATQSETQTIQLRCGVQTCEKGFSWTFNTRSVIRLEKCTPKFLEKMKEIATAPAVEYDNIRKNSAVLNSKYVRLPNSKFVVEMGIISAYDFLYNFIPVLDEDNFKKSFGENVSEIYKNNILFLTTVKSIMIPNKDGTYTTCNGYKEILDAIYNIDPSDFKILAAITNKFAGEYNSYFSFGDVTCPHCGNVTHDLNMTMDELVFQTFQQLLSTNVNVENMQDF
jgi:hypothetical protein